MGRMLSYPTSPKALESLWQVAWLETTFKERRGVVIEKYKTEQEGGECHSKSPFSCLSPLWAIRDGSTKTFKLLGRTQGRVAHCRGEKESIHPQGFHPSTGHELWFFALLEVPCGLPERSVPQCPRISGRMQEIFNTAPRLTKPVDAAKVRDVQEHVMWGTGVSQSEISWRTFHCITW